MRVHIWCPRVSDSAVAIRESLRSKGIAVYKSRANTTDRATRVFLSRVKPHDLWINWGAPLRTLKYAQRDIVILNNASFLNKYSQLCRLREEGVPCLETSLVPRDGYIGRSFNHQEGRDLIHNSGRDYYTKKLTFIREVRIHIYKGKSIHAGLKVPRVGFPNPHPWIRSYNTGWKIDYSHAADIAQNRRELAKKAVAALGLDFGAVDIGIVKGSNAVVIEVNTAPGLDEGPSVEAYVDQFVQELHR